MFMYKKELYLAVNKKVCWPAKVARAGVGMWEEG
jgi:hypothetical protein